MDKKNGRIKIFFLIAGDLALLYVALFAAILVRYNGAPEAGLLELHRLPFTILFILWTLVFGSFGLYDLRFLKNSKQFLYRLLRAMATNTVLSILALYLIPVFEIEPRRNLLLIAFFATVFIFIWRYLYNHLILRTPASKVLFFGINADAAELCDYLLKNPQLGYRPIAGMAFNDEGHERFFLPLFNSERDLLHIIRDYGIDLIVISKEIRENKDLVSLLFQVVPLGVGVLEFPKFYEMNIGKIPLSLIGEIWFLENLVGIRKNFYEFFKRTLDIVLALCLLLPTLITFPLIALTIKIGSPGSPFFHQKRAGKNGRIFELIKYRSTYRASVGENEGWNKDEKDVYTRIGRFLRKSYIDELPQLINVLRGEMSFIGPRPERPEFVAKLKEAVPFYEMRLLVPPGMTGWAQIHMENDASVEDAPEKMQYDLYYIKNRSLILDLLIALKTVFTLIRREGR